MKLSNQQIDELVNEIRINFRCFGGGLYTVGNPVAHALANQPPQFAAGVDVKEVIEFTINHLFKTKITN